MTYNQQLRFDWDAAKNLSNQRKHGVSFEDAKSLFESGVEHLELFDAGHSEAADRFLSIGPVHRGLIVVAWTERPEATIRVLSARLASRREREIFDSRMRGCK